VNPPVGYNTTDFTYIVTYTDSDNESPDPITVSIDGGNAQNMIGQDPETQITPTVKSIYIPSAASSKVSATRLYSRASDGISGATGDTNPIDGPTVAIHYLW